jgi:predicted AlkP superfamily phosphohydrolase/phosphomutase
MKKAKKVLVIGLDCVTPELFFDRWVNELPNVKRLLETDQYGRLESCIPAITCPAWMSMMTSKSPGKLGVYGFRNRKNYSYDDMFYANSLAIKESTVWDILGKAGKNVVLVGVPQTYPPKPVNGCLIADFLAPDTKASYTYPESLRQEIESVVDEYILDVRDFRTNDKDYLIAQIRKMTENRFKVITYLLEKKPWDFFMFVEIGTDRLHHGLWKYFDPAHVKYENNPSYAKAALDYYKYIDGMIGELLSKVGDDTVVFIVSDHGAKKMDGGICINDWLMKEGYLHLTTRPEGVANFKNEYVDWDRTVAWAAGGYYGRLFLNVKGREPRGVIEPRDYEKVRGEIKAKLEAFPDHNGKPIGTKAMRPEDIYPVANGVSPDLIIYFGDLYWRAIGTIGNASLHVFENDTGPDDANHAQHGIIILHNTGGEPKEIVGAHIMDIAPTILDIMDVAVPSDMKGKILT